MFSDLVGSTALSARMNPEDLREVISTYQKCVADTATVPLGTRVPQAHEGRCRAGRPRRAGPDRGGNRLKLPVTLQTRVDIAAGLVVVGDLIKPEDSLKRRNDMLGAITGRLWCQPLVTIGGGGGGALPMGILPTGAFPIGAFPIGALPTTGAGGGGWGWGKSAAIAASSIASDVAATNRYLIISHPSFIERVIPDFVPRTLDTPLKT